MSNSYIKKQLEKCMLVDLSNFEPSTNTYHIKKYSKPTYAIGKCYIIELSRDIINNTSISLSSNWNRGGAPSNEYYKIYVSQVVGAMIQVEGIAYDIIADSETSKVWSGYLPINKIELIKEL